MSLSLRLFVQDRPVESKAQHYVLWNYGPSFDIGEVEETEHGYRVGIRVLYRETIKNARTQEEKTYPHHLDSVGSLRLDSSKRVVEAPTLTRLTNSIFSRIRSEQEHVERNLIRAGKEKMGRLLLTQQMFTPLRRVATVIHESENTIARMSDFYSRYQSQIELLERANYVDIVSGGNGDKIIRPTSTWITLFRELGGDHQRFAATLLGDILATHYDYIVRNLRITQFMPYTRISATYYRPALAIDETVPIGVESLMDDYFKVYGKSPSKGKAKVLEYLNELDSENILTREQDYVVGDDDIFRSLAELQSQTPT